MRRRLRINGARGVTLLGFALVALVFGLAFNSPIAVVPPPPAGLAGLDAFLPLAVWGLVWYLAAGFLIVGAFREDQSRSMALFAGLLAVWTISYAVTTFTAPTDRLVTLYALQTAIYGGLLAACLGVARLVNSPPVDVAALRDRVLTEEGRPDDDRR